MPKLSVATRQALRKLRPPGLFWRVCGLSMISSINGLMSTLNYRMVRYDPAADPADEAFSGPAIFVFWHEYIFFPIHLRPFCRLAMLLSQHQDAEILSHVAQFAGLETVRGSTSRGGTAALKELIERGKGMSLAITPDGPRGPRRQLAQGCIYLSSRLQIPIVPIGFGCDRPWRNRSAWDQFAIPRLSSRARAVLGPRIQVPAGLERGEIELHRQSIECSLNMLTTLAEDWAEGRCVPPHVEQLVRSAPKNRQPCSPLPAADCQPRVAAGTMRAAS